MRVNVNNTNFPKELELAKLEKLSNCETSTLKHAWVFGLWNPLPASRL